MCKKIESDEFASFILVYSLSFIMGQALTLSSLPKNYKIIQLNKNESVIVDLSIARKNPWEKWPRALQIDFVLTMQIFNNLNIISDSQLEGYLDLIDEIDDDLQLLKNYALGNYKKGN